MITSYVDAQNTFGALIRTNFIGTVEQIRYNMAWTKEKPEIEGFYWVKANIAGKVHTLPVHRTSRNIKYPNTISSEGEIYNINDSLFKEWWNEQIIIQTEEEYFRAFILNNWNRKKKQ